jgi:hypothetical protein
MKFRLGKCANIFLKSGKVHRKQYTGNKLKIEIKELDSMKACKYLGVEENHHVEYKNEKERPKKEHIR